jgi:2-aminoadipate transaminase
MSGAGFDFTPLLRKGLPAPLPRFQGFAKYNFIGGHNDPEQVPAAELADCAAAALKREGANLAWYNLGQGPQGHPGLRDFVVDKVTRFRGIKASRDDVLITSGSGQGIDLISYVLVEPGDTIIMEQFSYGGAITRFKRLGADIVGTELDDQGIKIDALERLLDELKAKGIRPKLLYTIPTIQNPTGSIMPLERRRALLALCKARGLPIFEDECYTDLTWAKDAPPALYGLDPEGVIHIGSFSKTLAPALRIGYVVSGWPMLSRLITAKTDGGTGAVEQMMVAEYFSRNFERHVRRLAGVFESKLATMVEAVEREFGTSAEMWKPHGGIYLWIKLPDQVDVTKLIQPAAKAGVVFNAGPEWAADSAKAKSYLRLCFASPTHQQIRDGVAAFAQVCYEETGIPVRSANIRRA